MDAQKTQVSDASALTDAERRALDEQGFVVMHDILSREQTRAIIARIKEISETVGNDTSREAVVESQMIKVWDLVNAGEIFDVFYTHPRVLAAVSHVLGGDMKLHSIGSRCALPGYGHQHLHLDFGRDLGQPTPAGCNVLWALVDFSRRNGGTRLVPGSHRWAQHPRDGMADPTLDHPDEIRLECPAGSVAVFGGHTWHGGAQNQSEDIRWTVLSAYCKRDHPPEKPFAEVIDDRLRARLSEASRYLMDV